MLIKNTSAGPAGTHRGVGGCPDVPCLPPTAPGMDPDHLAGQHIPLLLPCRRPPCVSHGSWCLLFILGK